MPSTAKVFTKELESNPFGGVDPEDHVAVVHISSAFYKSTIVPLHENIVALRKLKLSVYGTEVWSGVDAFRRDWDDESDKACKGEKVRTECCLLRVMDDGILWTYHEKYYDGVYWETDMISYEELEDFFNPRGNK